VENAASQGEQVISEHLKMAEVAAKEVGAMGTATAMKSSAAENNLRPMATGRRWTGPLLNSAICRP